MNDNKLQTRALPKIDDLYTNIELATQQNALNIILNSQPKSEWVKLHPAIKIKGADGLECPLRYIPISTVEYILTAIFIKWRFEIKEIKLVANAVVTVGRLHVQDPTTGEWDWQDGTGAIPLQTDAKKRPMEIDFIKNNAVTLAAPASESEAIKDAAHKFGKIFGKDLNRRDEMSYSLLEKKFVSNISDIDKLKREVSAELQKYSGPDKETIEFLIIEKEQSNEFTLEFGNNILEQLKNGTTTNN